MLLPGSWWECDKSEVSTHLRIMFARFPKAPRGGVVRTLSRTLRILQCQKVRSGRKKHPSNCLSWRQFDRTVRPPFHFTRLSTALRLDFRNRWPGVGPQLHHPNYWSHWNDFGSFSKLDLNLRWIPARFSWFWLFRFTPIAWRDQQVKCRLSGDAAHLSNSCLFWAHDKHSRVQTTVICWVWSRMSCFETFLITVTFAFVGFLEARVVPCFGAVCYSGRNACFPPVRKTNLGFIIV